MIRSVPFVLSMYLAPNPILLVYHCDKKSQNTAAFQVRNDKSVSLEAVYYDKECHRHLMPQQLLCSSKNCAATAGFAPRECILTRSRIALQNTCYTYAKNAAIFSTLKIILPGSVDTDPLPPEFSFPALMLAVLSQVVQS